MVKKILLLLTIILIGVLAWIAAGSDKIADSVPTPGPRAMGATPAIAPPAATTATPLGGPPLDTPPPLAVANGTVPVLQDPDAPRPMIIPVAGIDRSAMRDTFDETRGDRRHEAIDIMAPRGTPVIATDDGVVKKLFTSVPGGLTVYEFDPDQRFCYYYAHLDGYAAGLHEGQLLRRGEVLGYVGTSGNAPKNAPHLHFALIRLDPDRRWWKGTYVNPYPLLR
jgi:murein DD-endopeptidase MepM/ murein hydrolase activator NlpD